MDEVIVTKGGDAAMVELLRKNGGKSSDEKTTKFSRNVTKRLATLQKTKQKDIKHLIKHFNAKGVLQFKGTEY